MSEQGSQAGGHRFRDHINVVHVTSVCRCNHCQIPARPQCMSGFELGAVAVMLVFAVHRTFNAMGRPPLNIRYVPQY